MTRILIAGFQHETNTFGATKASFEEFLEADGWPGLLQGNDVITGTQGINLPLTGFVEAVRSEPDLELIPVVWASAEPSAYVTDDAFERISTMILGGINKAGSIDGIYLDLHGAMVTESHEDGEGELLSRIRDLTGDTLPIVVSLDLHANVTKRMVAHASAFCIFRTYPHIDMAETGARCYPILRRLLSGETLYHAMRQASFLVPLSAQYTGASPCQELYQLLRQETGPDGAHCDIAMGFPPADIHDSGPAVVAYAPTQTDANAYADRIIQALEACETEFDSALLTAEVAVAKAMSYTGAKPVVIADVQDNPGAGATSDTTGLLKALVQGKATNAVLALLHDPECAVTAHELGVGAVFKTALGGKSGLTDMGPYHAECKVLALSDGRFAFSGAMYAGATAEIGPTALLEILDDEANVSVVVGSKRCQCLDQAIFTHIGVDPKEKKIVAVKSTVHFRDDFEPIADLILHAQSPGVNYCSLESVPYQNLRSNVRRGPASQ
jgi:microcystin degradation protein MlrC